MKAKHAKPPRLKYDVRLKDVHREDHLFGLAREVGAACDRWLTRKGFKIDPLLTTPPITEPDSTTNTEPDDEP